MNEEKQEEPKAITAEEASTMTPEQKQSKAAGAWKYFLATIAAIGFVGVGGQYVDKIPMPSLPEISKPAVIEEIPKSDYDSIVGAKPYFIAIKRVDGKVEHRTGGSISWRYNNPGKILFGDFAKANGALDPNQNHKVAFFKSVEEGTKANYNLLFNSEQGYKDKSVTDAIKDYAPTKDGYNPDRYLKYILDNSNINPATKMSSLSEEQKNRVLELIKEYENWVPGTVEVK